MLTKMKETLTSRRNPTVIKICSLTEKKNRMSARLFRFDGIKLYTEATAALIELVYVVLRESDSEDVISRLTGLGAPHPKDTGAEIIVLSDRLFGAVSEEKSPEGIICVAKYIDKTHKIATIDNDSTADGEGILVAEMPRADEKIIMLEDIRDPGNLGTILRSAFSLGISRVLLAGECADIYNPKTIRAAMGAIFRISTLSCRDGVAMALALRGCGRRVIAAALYPNALSLGEFELRGDDCIVIGNEGHGISPRLAEAADASIVIPMSEGAESLNAAAAATLFIWEISNCK